MEGPAGHALDAETGFVYLRARYYDPATGQYLSRDPIEALTHSAYMYVNGNPLNLTDPLGLFSLKDTLKGVSFIAGGIAVGVGLVGLVATAPVTVTVGSATVGVAAVLGGVSFGTGAGAAYLQCRESGLFSRSCKEESAGALVDLAGLAVGIQAPKLLGRAGEFIAVGADVVGLLPDLVSYMVELGPSRAWIGRAERCL